MQINIDKKTGILSGVIAVLIGVIIFLMGTQNSSSGLFGINHSAMDGENNSTNSSLLGSDAMFFEMMIPHHQQAIDISDLALTKSADSELLALAKSIRDEQSAEIVKMKAWLDAAGADLEMGHSMNHSMGGMLSDSELAALKAATGKSFDLLWLKGMTGHHDGAIDMAAMIENSKNPEIKSFAQAIVSSQSEQNKAMAAMLKRMG